MSRIIIIALLILLFLIPLGCKEEGSQTEDIIRDIIKNQFDEAKDKGKFGNIKDPEKMIIREITVDELNRQTMATVEMHSKEDIYLLTFDFRFKNNDWSLIYVGREERLSLLDLENPYRYWIRRFLYSSSFCFR